MASTYSAAGHSAIMLLTRIYMDVIDLGSMAASLLLVPRGKYFASTAPIEVLEHCRDATPSTGTSMLNESPQVKP